MLRRNRSPQKSFALAVLAAAFLMAGCSARRPAVNSPASVPVTTAPRPAPSRAAVLGEFTQEGVASWYGAPFDGRRTSDGETYHMHEMTAAHRTLPFNAIVRVTNLSNGRHVDVRINDRGPFVANRIIDLSYSAADALGMIGPGTARVRLDVLGGPDPNVGFFGVQVGAFQLRENARRLQQQLNAQYPPVTLAEFDSPKGVFYRVRAGHLASESAARELASEIQREEHTPVFVVRLDD